MLRHLTLRSWFARVVLTFLLSAALSNAHSCQAQDSDRSVDTLKASDQDSNCKIPSGDTITVPASEYRDALRKLNVSSERRAIKDLSGKDLSGKDHSDKDDSGKEDSGQAIKFDGDSSFWSKLGLCSGDVILEVDGKEESTAELNHSNVPSIFSIDRRATQITNVKFVRGDKLLKLSFKTSSDVGRIWVLDRLDQQHGPPPPLDVTPLDPADASYHAIPFFAKWYMLGIRLFQIRPSSEAARRGLRDADIVVRIGENWVADRGDFHRLEQALSPSSGVTITVMRSDQSVELREVR